MAASRKCDVNDVELSFLVSYIKTLRDVGNSKSNKDTKDAKRAEATRIFFSAIKRPANLWPLVRILMPSMDGNRVYGFAGQTFCNAVCKLYPGSASKLKSEFNTSGKKGLGPVLAEMANETSATPMTIGRLNALLDALARLDARQPAEASSQVASSATDKERARKNEETKKRRDGALRNILLNVVASETPLVVDVLLKTDPALGGFPKHSGLLNMMHKDFQKVYNTNRDANEVCKLCADPRKTVDPSIKVGKKFAVMRCAKLDYTGQELKKGDAAIAAKILKNSMVDKGEAFVVEAKLDGWRVVAHIGDARNTATYQLHGRSGFRSTDMAPEFKLDVIFPAIQQAANFRSAILDGELFAWNRKSGRFMHSTAIRRIAFAAKKCYAAGHSLRPDEDNSKGASFHSKGSADEEEAATDRVPSIGDGAAGKKKRALPLATKDDEITYPEKVELVFAVFDIVYLDGVLVSGRPLRGRHELLRTCLRPSPKEGVVLQSGRTPIRGRLVCMIPRTDPPPMPTAYKSEEWACTGRSVLDIVAGFRRIDAIEIEGIVVKSLSGTYEPGKSSWVKWKPSYGEDAPSFDCLVVGGYYSPSLGAQGGLTRFLVALRAPDSSDEEPRFQTFARVRGRSEAQQREVHHAMCRNFCDSGVKQRGDLRDPQTPAWLETTGGEVWPDKWICRYQDAPVLEVTGDTMLSIGTRTYAAGITIRFPVVRRRRELQDHSWSEVDTAKAAKDRAVEAAKARAIGKDGAGKGRSVVRKALQVDAAYCVATTGAAPVSNAFAGRHVHIVPLSCQGAPNQAGEERQAIAARIERLGGTLTAHVKRGRAGDVCVVGTAPAKRFAGQLRSVVKEHGFERDVLAARWLQRCEDASACVTPHPAEYVHMSDATLERLIGSPGHDKWGSNLTAVPADEDARALLVRQVPRAAEIWRVRAELTQRSGTKAERARELAALDAPEEATPQHLREVARAALKLPGQRRAAQHMALAGCSIALLFLPFEAEGTMAPSCPTSVACIDVAALAAAWIAYISFHGGRVVATSLEPSAAGRLELDGGGLGATSHVSLVPRDSAPLLTLGVRAVSDAAARAQLHTLATAGMLDWTRSSFSAALCAACDGAYEQLASAIHNFTDGRAVVHPATWLLLRSGPARQEALDATALALPADLVRSKGDPDVRRAWLADLEWPESVVAALQADARPAAPAKRRRVATERGAAGGSSGAAAAPPLRRAGRTKAQRLVAAERAERAAATAAPSAPSVATGNDSDGCHRLGMPAFSPTSANAAPSASVQHSWRAPPALRSPAGDFGTFGSPGTIVSQSPATTSRAKRRAALDPVFCSDDSDVCAQPAPRFVSPPCLTPEPVPVVAGPAGTPAAARTASALEAGNGGGAAAAAVRPRRRRRALDPAFESDDLDVPVQPFARVAAADVPAASNQPAPASTIATPHAGGASRTQPTVHASGAVPPTSQLQGAGEMLLDAHTAARKPATQLLDVDEISRRQRGPGPSACQPQASQGLQDNSFQARMAAALALADTSDED